MAAIGDIVSGLADQLSTIFGLRVTDYVPESITPPAAFCYVTEIVRETFDDDMLFTLEVAVLTRGAGSRIGVHSLNDLIMPGGPVWTAIEKFRLADGTQAEVVRYRAHGIETIARNNYFAGIFEVQVTTPT